MKKMKNDNNATSNLRKEKDRNHKNTHTYDKVILSVSIIIIVILISIIAYLVYKGNHPKLSDGKQVVASLEGKNFSSLKIFFGK